MVDTLGCLLVEAVDAAFRFVPARRDVPTEPRKSASGGVATALGARPLACRSLAGKPLIDWVLRRASDAELLQEIVVILPAGIGFESFRSAVPSGVTVYESDASDRLARLARCLDEFPARGVVNLRVDCPLLDPCLIDRLVSSVGNDQGIDYATFYSVRREREGWLQDLLRAQLGLFAEYFRADVLKELDRTLMSADQRRDFSSYVSAHPEQFVLRLVSLPPELDRGDLRLSLRHQDDWDHAEQIVDALGDEDLDWQQIVSLLQRHPHLRRRMADLNQADLKRLPR
jgi:spore coat polysaccharide biosynthesis protein SpsF (cytidylyltransferase family)